VTILSTGGTAKELRNAGIDVIEVSDYTDFPEMLDGRVKTLHPKIHAGILAQRNLPAHMEIMERMSFSTIELVVVNLYPFSETISKVSSFSTK
jgi:phosphoribosylaminoimidazolecarboxamide formyltransferase/IMP cyclohydrolase